MRIAVVGAGAIGGLLAARFAQAGHQVSVVIRGANLHAVREQGLRLETDTPEQIIAQVKASDRPEDLGHQDLVLLTMKAHQLWQMSPSLSPLIHPKTSIVTMQNGLPWWYFHKLPTAYQNQILQSVDPGGRISKELPVDQILGSVVYPAAELRAPGVIRLIEGNRFSIGEIDGADTGRLRELCQLFIDAGFKAPMSKDIRSEIWVKLWGNATFNPISALTHATLSQICGNPVSRSLIGDLMQEAQEVGEAFGVHFKVSINRRIDGAAAVGEHKTSMLQDVEAGRPMEIDALIGSVVELADIASIPVPRLKTVYACVKLLQEQLTQHSGRLKMATSHL
jgi:2-dehydropantoate 2-reductase